VGELLGQSLPLTVAHIRSMHGHPA
jgi:hypothetical protein